MRSCTSRRAHSNAPLPAVPQDAPAGGHGLGNRAPSPEGATGPWDPPARQKRHVPFRAPSLPGRRSAPRPGERAEPPRRGPGATPEAGRSGRPSGMGARGLLLPLARYGVEWSDPPHGNRRTFPGPPSRWAEGRARPAPAPPRPQGAVGLASPLPRREAAEGAAAARRRRPGSRRPAGAATARRAHFGPLSTARPEGPRLSPDSTRDRSAPPAPAGPPLNSVPLQLRKGRGSSSPSPSWGEGRAPWDPGAARRAPPHGRQAACRGGEGLACPGSRLVKQPPPGAGRAEPGRSDLPRRAAAGRLHPRGTWAAARPSVLKCDRLFFFFKWYFQK